MSSFIFLLRRVFIFSIAILLLTSCATIFGGTNYYAHVFVQDHPDATITYKGLRQKNGRSTFKVRRGEANRFSFTVKEANCPEQTFAFTRRTFRGVAFAGSILGWTGVVGGIPVPWGAALDLGTGSVWKPNVNEKGVAKIDHKNFSYDVVYAGCNAGTSPVKPAVQKSKIQRLRDLKELLHTKVLTQKEFEKEKKKILDEE